MITIKKTKDGAILSFGRKKLNYYWNDYAQDDFKKMLDDIRDLLGAPCLIYIAQESVLQEDSWND